MLHRTCKDVPVLHGTAANHHRPLQQMHRKHLTCQSCRKSILGFTKVPSPRPQLSGLLGINHNHSANRNQHQAHVVQRLPRTSYIGALCVGRRRGRKHSNPRAGNQHYQNHIIAITIDITTPLRNHHRHNQQHGMARTDGQTPTRTAERIQTVCGPINHKLTTQRHSWKHSSRHIWRHRWGHSWGQS